MIVQPAVEASVSQGELESVVQVQLQLILGILLEVTKLPINAAWKRNRNFFVKSSRNGPSISLLLWPLRKIRSPRDLY